VNNLRIKGFLDTNKVTKNSKIFLKQSYLIMTWFYYLTFTTSHKEKNKTIRFAFLPTRRKLYTLTKAPMAHKTNSKEQFFFKFYKFRMSVKTFFLSEFSLNSVSYGLLSLLNAKNNLSGFETNMLFLKHYTIQTKLSDHKFFNYSFFVKKNGN
jgi:hypothetical protein